MQRIWRRACSSSAKPTTEIDSSTPRRATRRAAAQGEGGAQLSRPSETRITWWRRPSCGKSPGVASSERPIGVRPFPSSAATRARSVSREPGATGADELGVRARLRAPLAGDARAVDAQSERRLLGDRVEHLVDRRAGGLHAAPAVAGGRPHRARRVQQQQHRRPVGRGLRGGRGRADQGQAHKRPGARGARSGAEDRDLSEPCGQADAEPILTARPRARRRS